MTQINALPPHMDWPDQEDRQPWPEALRRIILMAMPRELPARDWLNKWEPDAAKADALYAHFLNVLEEKKADHVAASAMIGLPCKDKSEAHFFAMSAIISEAKHDKGRAEEKAARAAQAKAASKQPRNRPSPYPAWMNEVAMDLAKRHPTHTPNRLAVSAIDAITTEAMNRGNLNPSLPSRATVMAWVRAFRDE